MTHFVRFIHDTHTRTHTHTHTAPPFITTAVLWLVFLDVDGLVAALGPRAAAEEACPVDCVMVTQLTVSWDVDTAVVDLA